MLISIDIGKRLAPKAGFDPLYSLAPAKRTKTHHDGLHVPRLEYDLLAMTKKLEEAVGANQNCEMIVCSDLQRGGSCTDSVQIKSLQNTISQRDKYIVQQRIASLFSVAALKSGKCAAENRVRELMAEGQILTNTMTEAAQRWDAGQQQFTAMAAHSQELANSVTKRDLQIAAHFYRQGEEQASKLVAEQQAVMSRVSEAEELADLAWQLHQVLEAENSGLKVENSDLKDENASLKAQVAAFQAAQATQPIQTFAHLPTPPKDSSSPDPPAIARYQQTPTPTQAFSIPFHPKPASFPQTPSPIHLIRAPEAEPQSSSAIIGAPAQPQKQKDPKKDIRNMGRHASGPKRDPAPTTKDGGVKKIKSSTKSAKPGTKPSTNHASASKSKIEPKSVDEFMNSVSALSQASGPVPQHNKPAHEDEHTRAKERFERACHAYRTHHPRPVHEILTGKLIRDVSEQDKTYMTPLSDADILELNKTFRIDANVDLLGGLAAVLDL